MTRLHRLLTLLVLAPVTALAQQIDYGSIDGFHVPHATLAARGPASGALDDDGTGFGVRVLSRASDEVMVLAEYHELAFDTLDIRQFRVGAGLAGASGSGVFLTYDRLALDLDDADVFGLHFRGARYVAESLQLYADAAYVGADGGSFYYDGFEFTVGYALDLPAPWGLFMDYRALVLEDRDNDDRVDLRQFRAGVRFRFDC